jgi:nicotinamidase-related amidase
MSQGFTQMKTALVVMDMQRMLVAARASTAQGVLDRLAQAIEIARKADMLIIYVTVHFREDRPEISPRNYVFSRLLTTGVPPATAMEIHPAVAPRPGDVVVTKVRVSAFTGGDFEVILRSQNITHLVLGGLDTGGVVLSTALEASDKDYGLTVLSDGCSDPDEEAHRVLITSVFPRRAEVLTVDEWGSR